MKLSIVATLYNSAPYILEFFQRCSAVAKDLANDDYEIVLVNDGSPDSSLDLAIELSKEDPHVVVVDLSRNFGHHKAMMTGLDYAIGDMVFLIDSDLEEAPEWLLSFAEQMECEQCDVVYGVQESRKGGWFERWTGDLYYRIFNLIANVQHPINITTARLMTRQYVDALLLHREREIVISCLWLITGFKQRPQIVQKRSTSPSTYNLIRKFSHIINAITSFSSKPLIGIFFTGMIILLTSLVYVLILVVKRLFYMIPVDGWTSIMVSIWILGGITISFLGIIGIYLSKVFIETKQRPYIIVRGVYGGSTESDRRQIH